MQIKEMFTERCILRPFKMDDVDEAYRVLDIHSKVYEFDPGYERTIEERIALIKNKIVEYSTSNGLGCLAVIKKDTEKMIGHCGLQGYFSEVEMYEPGPYERSLEIELYYKLHYDYWGFGFATEMCERMIEYSFKELRIRRIVTVTDMENIRSVNMLKRLGMKIVPDKFNKKVFAILNNTII